VDAKVLRNITDTLYASAAQKPLVIAPDGFFDYGWYSTFLKATGPGVIDFVTRHIYNLGPGLKAPPPFIYL
jgi:heparanase 1